MLGFSGHDYYYAPEYCLWLRVAGALMVIILFPSWKLSYQRTTSRKYSGHGQYDQLVTIGFCTCASSI